MLTYIEGNLFESNSKVLVNTVNTQGVMGKGIALQFKKIYPEMFKEYQALCETGKFNVGNLWLYKTLHKWILNFPTKISWRQPSKIQYIELGLKKFVDSYSELNISSIAFPPLGCGNGELDWDTQVQPLMEKYLKVIPIDISIYILNKETEVPEHKNIGSIKEWLRSEPRSLSFDEVWDDISDIVNQRKHFEVLDDKEQFTVSLNSEENLEFIFGGSDYIVDREDLYVFWVKLRDSGFLNLDMLPIFDELHGKLIISLFSNLDYCRSARVETKSRNISSESMFGLQIVARKIRPEQQQIELAL